MCTPVTVARAVRPLEVFPLQTLLILVVQVARVSGRPLAQLTAQAVCQVLLVLPVLHLLRAGCLGKAAAVAAVVLLARAVLAAQEAVARVVEAVELVALHTQPALAVSAVMAGHWWWSIDNAAICRC